MELAGPIKFCLSVQKEALINVPLLLFVSKLGELDVSALLVFFFWRRPVLLKAETTSFSSDLTV